MFDRKSDYALNKQDPEAIVCKSVTDIHIRLTRLDFASPEEFERWKRWSDENYHDTERQDHIYHNHILTLEGLTEVILTAVSPEEEVMDQQNLQERERLYGMLREALETRLTDMQRRRPVSYTHLDVYKRQVWDYGQREFDLGGKSETRSGGGTGI